LPPRPNVLEGSVPVAPNVSLGIVLFTNPASASGPLWIYCHANAELASEAEHLLPLFWRTGAAALLACDYRGFGWSDGSPSLSTLLSDTSALSESLPALLAEHGLAGRPLFAYGRSLGASVAAHLVSLSPSYYAGLVLDSGLVEIRSLPMVAMLAGALPNGAELLRSLPDPLGTVAKLGRVTCPLLILHSTADVVIPFAQAGLALRSATVARWKHLESFPRSGHNDLLAQHFERVTALMGQLLAQAGGGGEKESEEALSALSVKELRLRIAARGLRADGCVEKGDLVKLLLR
jgi:pimeloyl-ACP methyl ester carboxylesterase